MGLLLVWTSGLRTPRQDCGCGGDWSDWLMSVCHSEGQSIMTAICSCDACCCCSCCCVTVTNWHLYTLAPTLPTPCNMLLLYACCMVPMMLKNMLPGIRSCLYAHTRLFKSKQLLRHCRDCCCCCCFSCCCCMIIILPDDIKHVR